MRVRAKFNCLGISDNPSGEGKDVEFHAVYAEDGDNAEWSKWTPSGQLSMYVTNPAAFESFEPGKDYYLDITPAEEG